MSTESKTLKPLASPARSVQRFPQWILDEAAAHGVHYDELEVVEESKYSCLLPSQFSQVAAAYAKELGATEPRIIIDATANIGCDTIHFKRMYPCARVTPVEIDKITAEILQKNMSNLHRVLGKRADEVGPPIEAVNQDCVDYLENGGGRADLVYFDVPWGGPDYYKAKALKLRLGKRSLGDIVGMALKTVSPLVVVKIPVNADLNEFQASVNLHGEARFTFHDVNKLKTNKKGAVAYRLTFVRGVPI